MLTNLHPQLRLTVLPLTLTAPCTTNCLACFALLANNALQTATSSRRSIGQKVMGLYGVRSTCSISALSPSTCLPLPRPAVPIGEGDGFLRQTTWQCAECRRSTRNTA